MLLRFNNVSLRYQHDKYDTVSCLSLSLAEREDKTVFLGWQEGKTSVAKLIAGIIKPTRGEILYKGKPLECNKDNKIAVIFDNFALEENKTARHNLEFGMRLRKIDKAIRKDYLLCQAEAFGIEKHLDLKVKTLGSLNRLRVALSRAYWREVDLLVLDSVYSQITEDDLPYAREAVSIFIKKQNCAVLRLENPPSADWEAEG